MSTFNYSLVTKYRIRFGQVIFKIIGLCLLSLSTNMSWGESLQSVPNVDKPKVIQLSVGKSSIYEYEKLIARISVADAAIADVMVINSKQVYLVGKKIGATNVFIWQNNQKMATLNVSVGIDSVSVQDLLTNLMPAEERIRVHSAGDSLVLSGQVSDSMKVQQAVQVAQEFTGKKVINMMTTDYLPQVLLEVKIAEIDKSLSDTLGLQVQGSNFSFNMLNGTTAPLGFAANASGLSGRTNAWLEAQINSGLVKILAEPNIMALSGQEGEFLSGGIVFLPVPQSAGAGGTTITLQPQNYGVGVKFTPTVLSEGRINLRVSPQVSEVQTQGITVSAGSSTTVLPSITTRQASTTVQLYDGQSFAIGGLIKNNVAEIVSAFPGLANLPILGALFRSTTFKADRSELLIVVTPHVVQPLKDKPTLPTDKFVPPSQVDFHVNGELEGSKTEQPSKPQEPVVTPVIPNPLDGGAK
jgi:pilus assembly protein CpaC